ncbi:hypothetical protein [Roseovarius sp.]|nr:hypothetical protein [Roseovarius sp.]
MISGVDIPSDPEHATGTVQDFAGARIDNRLAGSLFARERTA